MKITYWSDYACPYCYIGEARLKKAMETLGISDKVEIEMKSFELDPNASKKVLGATTDRFAKKYGLTKEMAAEQIEHISQLGREEGIDFRYASTLYTNTLDAHRLTKLAQSKQDGILATKLTELLFDAYFTKNLELSDHQVLTQIAVEAGMNVEEVKEMLDSDKYETQVRQDESEASRMGIHGVPFFVVGEKYSLSGAQPEETFVLALQKVMEETQDIIENQGMTCGPNGCHIG
ncbi:MAG: DsbA family oxidoreductase [Lachnospiraceae bacterium]|nr:DsbA family oxidoreductase [Lachnospiraceae bacterium]MDD3617699.1 DsbA family oxidoreductase [Lachnospiraceae bacterium]